MRGIIFVILASLLFGINPSINKIVLTRGWSSQTVLLITSLVSAFLSLGAAARKKESFRIPFYQAAELFLIGIIGQGATSYLLLRSYAFLPVGISTFLHFFYPSIVCLFTALIYHEELIPRKVFAMITSTAGMLFIAGSRNLSVSGTGIILAAASSFAYAFYLIASDKWKISSLPCTIRLFYTSIGCTLFFFIFRSGEDNKSTSIYGSLFSEDFLFLFLNAALSFLAHLFINKAIDLLGSSKTAFINLLEPVTSLIVSSLLFHSALTPWNLLGCCLILSSAALICRDTRTEPISVFDPVQSNRGDY